jgi:hypothetical protein
MSDQYYDIFVSACGFLNRVQVIEQREGPPQLVCTFAALRGAKGERAEPTYFDAKVVGGHTKALLTQYRSVINDRSRKVFASVRLSDLYVKPFVRQKGERKGESGYALKTRLFSVESLAIDGIVVYRRSEDPTVESTSRRQGRDPQSDAPNGDGSKAPRRRSNAEAPAAVEATEARESIGVQG